jgi:hypothetical protein
MLVFGCVFNSPVSAVGTKFAFLVSHIKEVGVEGHVARIGQMRNA